MNAVGCLVGVGALSGVAAGLLLIVAAFAMSPLVATLAMVLLIAGGVATARRQWRRWARRMASEASIDVRPPEA